MRPGFMVVKRKFKNIKQDDTIRAIFLDLAWREAVVTWRIDHLLLS